MSSWRNEYTRWVYHPRLVSLCSGIIAPCGVKDDLLVYDKGKKVMVQFFEQCLLKNGVVFYVLPRLRLRMFTTVLHPSKTRTTCSPVVAQSDRSLFSRWSVVAQTRSLKLENVVCFELGSLHGHRLPLMEAFRRQPRQRWYSYWRKRSPSTATSKSYDGMVLLLATKISGTTYAHLALQPFACVTQGALSGDRLDFLMISIQRSQSRIGRKFDMQ